MKNTTFPVSYNETSQQYIPAIKTLALTNKFSIPLIIYFAEIMDSNFQISETNFPIFLAPDSTWVFNF